jgi:hypothetical protein
MAPMISGCQPSDTVSRQSCEALDLPVTDAATLYLFSPCDRMFILGPTLYLFHKEVIKSLNYRARVSHRFKYEFHPRCDRVVQNANQI